MIGFKISIKELKELLRDKRSIALNIILPFLVIILMACMYSFVNSSVYSKQNQRLVVCANFEVKLMLSKLENSITIIEASSKENVRKSIVEGKSELGVFWDDLKNKVYFFEDENQKEKVITLAKESITQIIILSKSNKNEATPIDIETNDISKDNTHTYTKFISTVCGYIVFLLVMRLNNSNAFYLSTKEKQFHTIEVLRVSPIRTIQLVLGKWLTNFIACLFITLIFFLMIFLGVHLIFSFVIKADINLLPKMPILLVGFALFAAIYSLLQLVLGFTAKTSKQAQLYLIYFPWILLIPLTIKFGLDLSQINIMMTSIDWITFIPVINIYNLIQMIFFSNYNIINLLIIFSTNCVLSLFFVFYLTRLFDSEKFLCFSE